MNTATAITIGVAIGVFTLPIIVLSLAIFGPQSTPGPPPTPGPPRPRPKCKPRPRPARGRRCLNKPDWGTDYDQPLDDDEGSDILAAADHVVRNCPVRVENIIEAIHYAGGLACMGMVVPMLAVKALTSRQQDQLIADLDRLNKGPRADAPA